MFTSSGVFTVPKGVKQLQVFCVGGGSDSASDNGGGGGYTTTNTMQVQNMKTISVTVASGQSNTIVGDITANGSSGTSNGGSGGGRAQFELGWGTGNAQPGGSDGSDGYAYRHPVGDTIKFSSGQGTTTRAFGEITGTLYAGGGGGGSSAFSFNVMTGANGGAGGGGNGFRWNKFNSNDNRDAGDGATNTGGGGGGNDGKGGSGIAIIRWGY